MAVANPAKPLSLPSLATGPKGSRCRRKKDLGENLDEARAYAAKLRRHRCNVSPAEAGIGRRGTFAERLAELHGTWSPDLPLCAMLPVPPFRYRGCRLRGQGDKIRRHAVVHPERRTGSRPQGAQLVF